MARKVAKKALAAEPTVSFTHAEFEKKVTAFLNENNACDTDEWLVKAKAKFLGHKAYRVVVTAKVEGTYELSVTAQNKTEAAGAAKVQIEKMQEDGYFDNWEIDDSKFEVASTHVEPYDGE